METSAIVRQLRQRTGLSQRGLAELAGTSGPTVADYEAGRKEPRLSTLDRFAEATGAALELRFVPTRHERALQRQRNLRLAIAAATAVRVQERWPDATELAEGQLAAMERTMRGDSAVRWIDTWRRAITAGPKAVRHTLLRDDEEGDDLRQVAPFAGMLSDAERRIVLAAAEALLT